MNGPGAWQHGAGPAASPPLRLLGPWQLPAAGLSAALFAAGAVAWTALVLNEADPRRPVLMTILFGALHVGVGLAFGRPRAFALLLIPVITAKLTEDCSSQAAVYVQCEGLSMLAMAIVGTPLGALLVLTGIGLRRSAEARHARRVRRRLTAR
jgi:hypothetical protein